MINELSIVLWDREFDLSVDYDCFDDETPTEEQIKALDWFVNHFNLIEQSKDDIQSYCSEKVAEDETNNKKDNIFSYIKPDYVFVKQEKERPRVALMCKYRYDQEHGIAIVLMPDDRILIGVQDIIL